MNGSLIDDLLGQLQGAPAGQIAQQLGTDPNTAQDAIAAALPMIVGALGRNAQQPGGAGDLFNALHSFNKAPNHRGHFGSPFPLHINICIQHAFINLQCLTSNFNERFH